MVLMDIAKARQYAKSRNGKLLSSNIGLDSDKVMWECSRGHSWSATPHSVVYMGRWCPYCYRDSLKSDENMMDFLQWAAHRDYYVKSEYINRAEPVIIACRKGHTWSVRPMNIREGTMCPYCSGRILSEENLDEILMERRWTLISAFPNNRRQKMKFRCGRGHVIAASYDQIRRTVQRCRACAKEDRVLKKEQNTQYDYSKGNGRNL